MLETVLNYYCIIGYVIIALMALVTYGDVCYYNDYAHEDSDASENLRVRNIANGVSVFYIFFAHNILVLTILIVKII